MSFCYQIYNIRSFLHFFLHLHPFSFICMFISIEIKWYRSDDGSGEGTNTEDLDVDFERIASQAEDGEDEDMGFSSKIERMVA